MVSKPSSSGLSGRGDEGSVNVGEENGEAAAHLHGVLARRHELLTARRGLERLLVRELPLGVVAVLRLAHRRAEHAPVAERRALDLATQLDVLRIAIWIRRDVIKNDCSHHALSV